MNRNALRSRHLDLDLDVDFTTRRLTGSVTHVLDRAARAREWLELDIHDLKIDAVEAGAADDLLPRRFECGESNGTLGAKLRIETTANDRRVRIRYRTSPAASGLQWLRPEQTRGGRAPYLYTQGQTIHTRSWIPCFDRPQLRMTYSATIRTDPSFRALMAAPRRRDLAPGVFQFEMPFPIPSYLFALAVGNFASADISPRCAVHCEPELLDAAIYEFAETETMLHICERLFGPYRWERYDLLVLPPSAPLGGMENPTLTFVTPTILAGDRSLVAIVAHELAHSWSGNLVCNASWGDFWLNEGFTVYVERRILERLYGRERAALEAAIGHDRLMATLASLADHPERTRLAQPEPTMHPDHAITDVPYEKGYLFLRRLEQVLGRAELGLLLRRWFDQGAFQARSSAQFRDFLEQHLKAHRRARELDLTEWFSGTGLPADCPAVRSQRAEALQQAALACVSGHYDPARMDAFQPLDWILFLRYLRDVGRRPDRELLRGMAARFGLDSSKNAELLSLWLAVSLAAGRDELLAQAHEFLLTIGRNKLIAPVYDALLSREDGAALARSIYAEARPRYHDMVHTWLDSKLGFSAAT